MLEIIKLLKYQICILSMDQNRICERPQKRANIWNDLTD
jgi:hypothetical protein